MVIALLQNELDVSRVVFLSLWMSNLLWLPHCPAWIVIISRGIVGGLLANRGEEAEKVRDAQGPQKIKSWNFAKSHVKIRFELGKKKKRSVWASAIHFSSLPILHSPQIAHTTQLTHSQPTNHRKKKTMSRRKQATTDIITDIPELEEGQRFARVLGSRGKSIHEVQFSDGEEILVNLPPKFRSLVWVKRGNRADTHLIDCKIALVLWI